MRKRVRRYNRRIKSLILVICEGQTERAYIEFLARLFRLPVEIRTKVSGANINARLIKSYVQELRLGNDDICKIFLMYDADIPAVVNRLEKLNETLILTNPCIELWFLLHMRNHNRETSSAEIVNALMTSHIAWNSYEKGILSIKQKELLTEGMNAAIARAGQLQKGRNPYTNIQEFIRVLENEKNA